MCVFPFRQSLNLLCYITNRLSFLGKINKRKCSHSFMFFVLNATQRERISSSIAIRQQFIPCIVLYELPLLRCGTFEYLLGNEYDAAFLADLLLENR